MLRIGIDVGGTNTDAVVMDGRTVVASIKAVTTQDVMGGVVAALEGVPGANVLTRATLRVKVEQYLLFQRVCAIVTGNAGAIE